MCVRQVLCHAASLLRMRRLAAKYKQPDGPNGDTQVQTVITLDLRRAEVPAPDTEH